MTFARVATLLGACGLAALAACSSTEKRYFHVGADGGVSEFTVSKSIGTSGGSLEVTDPSNPAFGAGINVPPGALAQNTTISIGPDARPAAVPYGLRTVGPAVDFGPVSAVFSAAPTFTMPYQLDPQAGERLVVLQLGKTGGTHTMAAGTGNSGPGGWTVLETQASPDNSRRVVVTSLQLGLFIVAAVGNGVALPDGGMVGPDGSIIFGGDGGSTSPDGGVRPTDHQPPVFAGLVAAELDSQTPGQVTLTWDAATDDQTPQSAIRYKLYLPSFATIGVSQYESPPGVTTLSLPVSPGVTYYFLVRAVDAAGNEDSNFKIKSLDIPTGGPILGNLGDTCQQAADCQSGSCADGVCCENACTGSCTFCNGAGRPGRCDPAAAGTDPRAACTGAGAGQVLLCDAQQKCTLCQPLGSTEICNNGIDDNGDHLVDLQDPACAVCAPPRLLCTAQKPSFVSLPDFAAQNLSSTGGIAWNGSVFGVATTVSPPVVTAPLPSIANLRRYDPAGAVLDETAVQMQNDTSTFPGPAVVANGAGFAMGWTENGASEFFQLVGGNGVAVGNPALAGTASVSASQTGVAAASTGGGFGLTFAEFTQQETGVIDFAHLNASGALVGSTIPIEAPSSSLDAIFGPVIVDNADTQDFTIAYVFGQAKGPLQARAARIGYNATTPSILPTNLTAEAQGLFDSHIALASLGTNNILAFVRNNMGIPEVIAQLYDGAFNPIGPGALISTGVQPDTIYAVGVSGISGVVVWGGGGQLFATRVDLLASSIRPVSTLPLNTFTFQRGLSTAGGAFVTSTGSENAFGLAFNAQAGNDQVVFETLCNPGVVPSNDACANPIAVKLDDAITGTTASAGAGGFGACASVGKNVFYKITMAQGEQVVLRATPTLGGIAAITVADSCTPVANSCVTGSSNPGQTASTVFTAPADGDYLISVEAGEGSLDGPGTDFILSVERNLA